MIRIAVAILCFTTTVRTKRQPNILLIIADDYGYNDIGYHGSEIKTPVLDRLAADGVKLENYYVQPICSPSRSQLMTGRYQIHTGIQHAIFWPLQPNGLPLQDPTLADKLREAGYSTHAVGKWHLGFFKEEYLPTNRGFDTFFGILNGKADHYQYNDTAMGINGLDLRDGIQRVNNEYRGQYSTNLYTKKAVEIVEKHDSEKPLFMYLSYQAVHLPLQVPDKYLKQYGHIKDMDRKIYAVTMYCQHCGENLAKSAHFCTNCGKSVTSSECDSLMPTELSSDGSKSLEALRKRFLTNKSEASPPKKSCVKPDLKMKEIKEDIQVQLQIQILDKYETAVKRVFPTSEDILSGKISITVPIKSTGVYWMKKVNEYFQGNYKLQIMTICSSGYSVVDNPEDFKIANLKFEMKKFKKKAGDLQAYIKFVDKGMTSAMDEGIGDVVKSFQSKGLWQDTLVVFTTDNGGQVLYGGDNWPLRGWKGSLWEGGVKAVGFVHGQMIQKKGAISKELIHISDWFPTLINLANGSLKRTNPLDGVDQWRTISYGQQSQRNTVLHNIDPLFSHAGERKSDNQFDTRERAALRHNEWKIITGDPGNGSWIYTSIRGQNQNKLYERPDYKNVWLFNIENDPYEKHDLSTKRPEVVTDLLEMLAKFELTSVPCFYPENDFMADPKYHEGYWGPWIQNQEITKEIELPSNTKIFRFSFLSIFILALYCLYYRYKKKHPHKISPY